MIGIIDGFDFGEMEIMKYYAPPASWDDAKKKDVVHSRIFSGDWYAAEKKDGFFGKFVKDENGDMLLYSRSRGVNGKFANKIDWVPQLKPFFDSLPNGTCLLGELYLPKQPGSKCVQTILGCLADKAVARQAKGEKIHFYVFDCLAYNGHNMMKMGYKARIDMVEKLKEYTIANHPAAYECVEFGQYYNGALLWTQLQTILANGGEGMVIVYKDAPYEPGKRPSKTTLKVKKELQQNIDCFFTGRTLPATRDYTGKEIETWQYWLDTYTGEKKCGDYYKEYKCGATLTPITRGCYNGWAGSLEIGVLKKVDNGRCTILGQVYEGYNVVSLGWLSGVTDEMKAAPEKFAFKPIEVAAMELFQDGRTITLRHGKLKQFRSDLSLMDCTWEKI